MQTSTPPSTSRRSATVLAGTGFCAPRSLIAAHGMEKAQQDEHLDRETT
jgi:hypothetical protein